MTTRLPVTCAVKSPRLKKPMTSTMPAITLSRAGSRISNLAPSRASVLCVTEAIDDDFRDNEAEAHRQNDRDSGHAVGDRCSKKLQRRLRARRELDEAARHSEEEDAGYHRHHRGKADGCERHVPATCDRRADQPDHGAGNERARRGTKSNGKRPPPQRMSEYPDRDRPGEHS